MPDAALAACTAAVVVAVAIADRLQRAASAGPSAARE